MYRQTYSMIEGTLEHPNLNRWWGFGQFKTKEKENALKQFKQEIKDFATEEQLKDDTYCKRWLIARDFDVPKAVTMFRNSMEFRKKMKVDELVSNYKEPEVITKYMPGGEVGHDKEGSSIRVVPWGDLDMKGLMLSCKKLDFVKSKIVQFERTLKDINKMTEKLKRDVVGQTIIFDMENVGLKTLWKPGLDFNIYLSRILEDNYPEMMKRLFLINAPKLLPVLYTMAQPLISESMKQKIFVLGNDYQTTLLQYIDGEELPAYLGGKKTDPDGNPKCTSLICYGGTVPESNYLENTDAYENMITIELNSGEKKYIEFQIESPESILQWEYKTDKHDIGFSVFKKENDEELKEIVTNERMDCFNLTIDGIITVNEPGTYFLCFDNSYSMLTSKVVHYRYDVLSS
ncbi:Retinal-binding protein [Acanthosepion pharaonis]|uniref:Retinal-binding protein n=1 Tax=Acanthosepion pharaonis TaxID=158019 RepID=A0A812ENA0_ACAPH|nr:Retinal-binding protein [Sepia pharaonis]